MFDPSMAAKAGKAAYGSEHLAAKGAKVAYGAEHAQGTEKLAAKASTQEVRPEVKAVSHNG
jgi:hypothetical protein